MDTSYLSLTCTYHGSACTDFIRGCRVITHSNRSTRKGTAAAAAAADARHVGGQAYFGRQHDNPAWPEARTWVHRRCIASFLSQNGNYSVPVGDRSIAISLLVCLSVREHISGTAGLIFTNFCRSLWPWLGPSLAALRYVMYFRFYG